MQPNELPGGLKAQGIYEEVMSSPEVKKVVRDLGESIQPEMREAFAAVWQVASEHSVSVRTAAFIVACTRILQAREMRGLYP